MQGSLRHLRFGRTQHEGYPALLCLVATHTSTAIVPHEFHSREDMALHGTPREDMSRYLRSFENAASPLVDLMLCCYSEGLIPEEVPREIRDQSKASRIRNVKTIDQAR